MRKRRSIFMLILLIALASIVSSGQLLNEVAFATPQGVDVAEPIIESYLDRWSIISEVETAPIIDGILDDEIWEEADSLSGFVTAYFNDPAEEDTEVKLVYDSENLYVAMEHASIDEDISLANFEIILSPDAHGDQYYSIPIQIRTLDVRYVNSWGTDTKTPENIKSKVNLDGKKVTAEVAIPLASLGVTEVNLGDEWRLNVIAQHEMNTKSMSSWVPIRRSSITYTGGSTSTIKCNLTDEGRLGSIFMGQLTDGQTGETQNLWEPEEMLFKYKSFTEKELSFKNLEMSPSRDEIQLKWKSPDGNWHSIDRFETEVVEDTHNIMFEHPVSRESGLYKLQVSINGGNGDQMQSALLSFDRHSLISAGDTLFFNPTSDNGHKEKITSAPPSEEVEKLLELIPEKAGFNFCGIPDQPHLKPDPKNFKWSSKNPHVLTSAHGDKLTYPNPDYPEDKKLIVENSKGESVEYPYYEDEEGRRYFLTAHLWYRQRDYIVRQLGKVAEEDPLGAARLIYRFAEVYEGYVPTNDHLWHNQPIDPASGPPYHWWGGMWQRWAACELLNLRYVADAYAIVNETNAFDVLSQEVGEDVQQKIIKDMFEPSIEFYRTFPILYHNMEYRNAEGLTSLGWALGDSSYIHEAVEWAENFAMETYLFDGFFKETTVSYHNQSTDGINLVIDALKGWSDPQNYISPRSGNRLEDLDMREKFPALKKSAEIANLLAYPDGKNFPTQDTWAHEESSDPRLDLESLLLPASGIARLGQGRVDAKNEQENSMGETMTQLYLTFQPKYGHHHFDPLNLVLYDRGQELLPDIGYTHTLYRQWTATTLAHNTVVVDSDNMDVSGQAAHGGNVEVFMPSEDGVQVMRASQQTAYSQTDEYSREPWLIQFPDAKDNEGYILDLFRVYGGERHEYTLQGDANHDATFETDLTLYDYGPYLLPAGVEVCEPETETDRGSAEGHYYGYIYVRNVEEAILENSDKYDLTLVTEEDGTEMAKMKITGLLEPGQNELFLGESPSLRATRLEGKSKDNNNEAVKYMMPKMVLRREGDNLASNFITAIEPYASGETPRIESIERLIPAQGVEGDIAVKVTYGDTTDIILSSLDPSQPLVVDDIILEGKMGMIRLKDGEVQKLYLVGGNMLRKGDVELKDEGPVSGTINRVHRQAEGYEKDAFITDTKIPGDMEGQTIVVTHPDGKTHGYTIKKVSEEKEGTIIQVYGMDPGFTISEDGTSALKFYPFTKWTGDTTFRIENNIIQMIEEQEINVETMQRLIDRLEDEGESMSDSAVHSLRIHLTAVGRFEGQEEGEKVVKHMEGFKLLLEHQKKDGLISERAYDVLKSNADSMIERWDLN